MALAALVTITAACSSSSSSSTTTTTGSSSSTSALGTPKKATGTPIKIGFFNVQGGTTVSLPNITSAAQASVSYANAYLGGIAGHPIQLVVCDDKDDGVSETACANTFVSDGVVAVVAGQPAQADLLIPTVHAAGIPYFGSSPASAGEITTKGLFFDTSGFLGTLSVWASYAKEMHYKTFNIMLVDNPQAVAAVKQLGTLLFGRAGVTLQTTTIPQGTADATAQATAALAQNPDAFGIVGDMTTCQSVLGGLQTAGNTKPIVGIVDCTDASVIKAVGAGATKGMVVTDAADTVGGSANTENALYEQVMAKYSPATPLSGQTVTGWQSMLGFIRAANAGGGLSGSVTPALVNTALSNAVNVPLPLGNGLTFSCNASAITAIVSSTICNSKFFMVPTSNGQLTTPVKVVDAATLFNG